jgi:hypothetical protein
MSNDYVRNNNNPPLLPPPHSSIINSIIMTLKSNYNHTELLSLQYFKLDINRNVGVRDICNDDNTGISTCQPFAKLFQYRSLPNIAFGEYDVKMSPKIRETETTFYYRASSEPNNNYISNPCIVMEQTKNDDEAVASVAANEQPEEEEHAISGRLEIRVLSKDKLAKEPSPNPEESIYFDAVITNGPQAASNSNNGDESKPKSADKENVQYEEEFIWINKKEPQEKKYDIKVYEDSLKIQKYKIITVDKSEDALDDEDGGAEEEKDDDEKEKEIVRAMQERDESTTDNRIENERLRDCSSSSNSKIPVFNPTGSARMLSQRSSWAGMEDGPDISDLTPGKRRF